MGSGEADGLFVMNEDRKRSVGRPDEVRLRSVCPFQANPVGKLSSMTIPRSP